VDEAVAPAGQARQIDIRRAEVEAIVGSPARMLDLGRGMQQCLGRNTATVKTDAADGFGFNGGHVEPQLCGTNCGMVATGAGADDDQVVAHESFLMLWRSSDRSQQPLLRVL